MSITAVNPVFADAATPAATPAAAAKANPTSALASESTFLQLLVAQLKNQNPLNPADGTQFVAQLAQFSTLEQNVQMRTDLDGILKALQAQTAPATPAGGATTPPAGA